MVVSSRERGWPESRRALRIRLRRLARLGTPVLVVSAALFGAAVSAAVLVGFWNDEASRRKSTETRLTASTVQAKALERANARLRRQVAGSRETTAQLQQSATRMQAAAQALIRENAALVGAASALHTRGGSLERRAASVSKLADTLGNDLVAVLSYITNTSAASLDPSYLEAQLSYLQPAIARVRSAAGILGAEAGGYGTAVDRFAAQAGEYSAALRTLGHPRAPTR